MATAGGLEIHQQLSHAAPPLTPEPAFEAVPGGTGVSAARVAEVPPIVRPRDRSAWPKIPALAMAVVILLLTGVASAVVKSRGSSALSLVQEAAATTSEAKTARVSATVKTDSGPLAEGVTVDGGYDFTNRRADLKVDPAKYGAPGIGTISAIVDYSYGLVMYMKFPQALAQELGGKPWVKLDVSAVMRQAGMDVDIGSLLQGQSNDPTSGLGLVRGADSAVNVGTEQVRGTDTTHYRLQINIDKAIADAPTPAAKEAMTKLANLYTVRTFPVEVWLDGDGRVRRFQENLDTATIRLPQGALTNGDPFRGHVSITYELYDFGGAVNTELPPASQVTDLNALLNQGR